VGQLRDSDHPAQVVSSGFQPGTIGGLKPNSALRGACRHMVMMLAPQKSAT
jgi:hypothetical protein